MNIINSVYNSRPFETICNITKATCKISKVAFYIFAISSVGAEEKIAPQNNPLMGLLLNTCPRMDTIPYPLVEVSRKTIPRSTAFTSTLTTNIYYPAAELDEEIEVERSGQNLLTAEELDFLAEYFNQEECDFLINQKDSFTFACIYAQDLEALSHLAETKQHFAVDEWDERYTFVKDREPQPGEIVYYYDPIACDSYSSELVPYDAPNTDDFSHFGVYLGGHMVISRWGENEVVRHGLFDIPADYGTKAVIVRKKLLRRLNLL